MVTKILVADDHDLVRMGIVRMLSDIEGFAVVGEAKTGEEAITLARQNNPDVVLMDVKMPGIGGLEATRRILAACESTRVIAVTAMSDDLFPERFMRAGAAGYVTKETGFDEMIEAIHAVVKGGRYVSSSVAQQLALRNFGAGNTDTAVFDCLSERELQTAIMIANGTKVNAIAEVFSVSPKTINSYRYRIFDKLNIHSDVELTLLAVKHKILDVESLS